MRRTCCAFLRVAVDIRNIDVEAASRAGVLVTHATAGFIPSVAEIALGLMVDLGRRVTRSTIEYRRGKEAEPAWAGSSRAPRSAFGLRAIGV